jgi:hypothetical protein
MPDFAPSQLVTLYSAFVAADPSGIVVPLVARRQCLESAVHNVRTGLIHGLFVDRALYRGMPDLVDAVTREAHISGVIDTIYTDRKTGSLVGDCAAVKAVSALTEHLVESIADPLVLMYRDDWETRVAMTALSGKVTMMEIVARETEELDAIPTGCVVEYAGYDDKFSTEPYDLVVNPPGNFAPAAGQHVLHMSDGNNVRFMADGKAVRFEAMRAAYSVGMFRGLPEKLCGEAAERYEKNLQTV